VVAATWLPARVEKIKIALLGPIVPSSNPIRVAEEVAMLDTLVPGRIVVGLLRGTPNEHLSYDLNPQEARERTDEGMELILRAWAEPQPFGWQGQYFQYRTVSIWPRPHRSPRPFTGSGLVCRTELLISLRNQPAIPASNARVTVGSRGRTTLFMAPT
jgi:alkanesulfonate monooxygenase SsuD/methylene tetrahydromethanopterin reductase-like flavin-dependent oxidoreductase (luciferase family)